MFINIKTENIKIVSLSYSQQQMWIINQVHPGNYAYNLPVGFRLKGELNVEVLEKSFNEIVKRHETLRTTFGLLDDQPRQLIHRECLIKIKIIGLCNLSYHEGEKELSKSVFEEVTKPFDLSKLPLIRVTLINLSIDESILILNTHHIISDGLSVGIIFHELSDLYNNFLIGTTPNLTELPIQYSDYVNWQHQKDWNPTYVEQLNFWAKQLDGALPNLELPFDKHRPAIQTPVGSNEFFFLSKDLTQKIQSLGIKRGCTFFITLLAAFQVFLSKYSGSDEIIIGTPISNRPRRIDENLIGNFLNIVALRTNLSDNPDFLTLLRRTQKITLDAIKNRDLPFEKIVEHLKIERDLSRNPIFQVMLQISPKYSFELSKIQISSFNFDLGYSQFDLSLHLYQGEDGYNCRIEYDTDLFEKSTIKRMVSNFQYFLNEIIEKTDLKISEISILNPEEKNTCINGWNNTYVDFHKDTNISNLFEKQVEKTPNSTAIIFENYKLTYFDLNEKANKLSNYLFKNGVKPGSFVGICIERSPDMITGLLGILKTGAAYIPLDPLFPKDRLKYILEDSKCSFLITQEHLTNLFTQFEGKLIFIDKESNKINNESAENPKRVIDSSSLAYAIYTSGSTGKPKGVLIEHKSVVNVLLSMQKKPGFTHKDVLVAVTTISFDIAVLELFLPLIAGGKVVIAGRNEVVDGNSLLNLIKKFHATVMQATPSTWKLMIEAGWTKVSDLKMLCGGETLPRDLANKMLDLGGELWNMYGPTETTIWSSVKKIEAGKDTVVIGPPIDNTQFYIVDKKMQLVPIGVVGELLIGGDGLARGYWNRLELNQERFIQNPFKSPGSSLYRTGDLVRYYSNGDIEFLGRTDFQVKIRGYRIELGEIEKVLSEHKEIKEAVVVAREDKNHDKRLVAYIIPSSVQEIKTSDLRNFLKEKLPEYMIPSFFVTLGKFPLTPNAKIDRKVLPEPDTALIAIDSLHIGPRDEIELQLTAIWEKALGKKGISINDNFFDLGGHSLLAAQIFAQTEQKLKKSLPLALLFQSPTIMQIADLIRQKEWKPSWKSLVPIQTKGSNPPLFLIHGAEGNVLLYKDLVSYLGEQQPVYGLQSKGIDGSDSLIESFEDMATHYINEIKSMQPHGPYFLGGYCLGGTIAFEMAKQILQNNEQVALVAMIETYNIKEKTGKANIPYKLIHKFQIIYFQLRNILISNPSDRFRYIKGKSVIEFSRFKININIFISSFRNMLNRRNKIDYHHLLIKKVNDKAQNYYLPLPYDGEVVLFKPQSYFAGYCDEHYGWNMLAKKGVKIINLPTFQRGSLSEPYVKDVATKLELLINNIIEEYNIKNSSSIDNRLITGSLKDN